jgi:hypothetical protein
MQEVPNSSRINSKIDGSEVCDDTRQFLHKYERPGGYGHVSTVESNILDRVDIVDSKHKTRQVETLTKNCSHYKLYVRDSLFLDSMLSSPEPRELDVLECVYWKKKTAATPKSARTGVLALAMVAAAPVLEALAAVELDEPRADAPELEVTTEVTVLLDPLAEPEVRVGEMIVVL